MGQVNIPVSDIVDSFSGLDGPLLPVLHHIQNEYGYIPEDVVPAIASALKLSRADIQGVISFYHQFRQQPGGQHRVQICRAEACQAMGSARLEAHAEKALGLKAGETTADGSISLDPVYCLGNCACGPSLRIGDAVYARVNEEQFDQLISELQNAEAQA